MNKTKRLYLATKRASKARAKARLARATRQWIEANEDIHAMNYWFYRYFTNRFELYLINRRRQ